MAEEKQTGTEQPDANAAADINVTKTVLERVVAFFATTSVYKIKGMLLYGKTWVRYAVIAVVILSLAGGIEHWRDLQLTRQISTLQTEIQAKAEQIKAVETERNGLKTQIEELKKQLTATQIRNDSNVKEAGRNEYKKVMSLKDTAIVDYYNNVYRPGVVRRNAEWKRQNYNPSD